MKGTIFAYADSARAGVIRASDGSLHYFAGTDWVSGQGSPQKGQDVVFQAGPQRAFRVRLDL